MVDRKISADASLAAGSIAGGDLLAVVDISEVAAADRNKNISFTILETYLNTNLNFEVVDATIIRQADVDDTPVNGVLTAPISSNWAFDHEALTNEHIDWTAASDNFLTTGTVKGATVYAGNPTLTTDDQFFLGAITGTQPRINFDDTDLLQYDRTVNTFSFVISNIEQLNLGVNTADFKDNAIVTTGDGKIGGILYIANDTLTTDDFFYLSSLSATAPRITLDDGDFIQYDRTANTFSFTITNIEQFNLSESLADFKDNGIQTSGGLLITGGDITLNASSIGSQFGIGSWVITGGTSTTQGGNIHFYGDADPDLDFFGGATLQLKYNDSESLWNFQANEIRTTGLFTSIGIDDNCTGERLDLTDGALIYGESSTADFTFHRHLNTGRLILSSGNNASNGLNMRLNGGAYAGGSGGWEVRSDSDTILLYAKSTDEFDFLAKVTTEASATAAAGFNITPGVDPTSPANGDIWTTAASVFARINGVTEDLLAGGESLWDEQNTSITGVLGKKYVKASGASHTITLPVGPSHSAVPNYVMVWNNDTDTSTVTVDPNGTNSITLQGASLGAGVAVILQPGEALLVVGRQAGPGWDGMYLSNRSFAANTISLNNTTSENFPTDTKVSGLTEEATPVAGDWLLGEESGGALRKFDVGNIGGGGGLTTTYKIANYTAVAGDFVTIDLGGTARTVTLPATIAAGDRIAVHCFNTSATAVDLTIGRNSKNIRYRGIINGDVGDTTADDVLMRPGDTIELIAYDTSNWEIV